MYIEKAEFKYKVISIRNALAILIRSTSASSTALDSSSVPVHQKNIWSELKVDLNLTRNSQAKL